MEFSLGRDALPSQARSMRGESRRLRRERDNAKDTLIPMSLRRIALRDRAVVIMRPVFSATWRTAADAKSVHDHLSRHHAGPIIDRARFDISLGTSTYMPAEQTGNRCREPRFAASPLAPQPDERIRVLSMAVSDLASPVTQRNHNLTSTAVIKSLQATTCATMLALTSHYMATNAKHPRYAREPGQEPGLGARGPGSTRPGVPRQHAADAARRPRPRWPGSTRPTRPGGRGSEDPLGCVGPAPRLSGSGAHKPRRGGYPERQGGRVGLVGQAGKLGGGAGTGRRRSQARSGSGRTRKGAGGRGCRHGAGAGGRARERADTGAGAAGVKKTHGFRHARPEPNTVRKRLTVDG